MTVFAFSEFEKLDEFKRLADELQQSVLKPKDLIELPNFTDNENITTVVKAEWIDPRKDYDTERTVKRKAARFLDYDMNSRIRIAASSGTLVEELAITSLQTDTRLIAIVPPRIPEKKLETLLSLGSDVVRLSLDEDVQCPREATVFYTRGIVEKFGEKLGIQIIDQYKDWKNAFAHYLMTGPETFGDGRFGNDITHLIIPLGSTGSFVGNGEFIKDFYPSVRIIGVQPSSKDHHVPGVQYVIGKGCAWKPELFEKYKRYDGMLVSVDDADVYAMAIEMWKRYPDFNPGISTLMNLTALRQLERSGEIKEGTVAVLSADSDYPYPEWTYKVLTNDKIVNEMVRRHPGTKEDLPEYLAMLRNRNPFEDRLKGIVKTYNPEGRRGQLYTQPEFFELVCSKSFLK